MRYSGREIDVIELWSRYVEFPANMQVDGKFLPLVRCPNPAHDTSKRHFQINVQDGLVHCFAQCGISGTFTKAISIIEGCDERQARRSILQFRTKPTKDHSKGKADPKPSPNIKQLSFSTYIPQAGIEYLDSRGITENSIAAWEIGWDTEGLRLAIPAKDQNGITKFFILRSVLERQKPKYLYTPEGVSKNSLLFGALHVDSTLIRSEGLILVEGSLDAIRLWQHGIRNAVATLGTGVSEIQCRLIARLRPKRIWIFFDRDSAGIHGIEIAQRRLQKYPIRIVRYPRGRNDPAECTRREVERAISRAIPYSRLSQRIASSITGGR